MADNAVAFELVSPQSLLISEDVEMVVVPGGDGDFGVLPNHSPLISTVRPGVIHIFAGGSVKDRIFIAGGFAEVTPAGCTVLAEEALPVGDLDRAAIERDLADSNDDVRDASNDAERDAALRSVAIAEAKLSALDSPQYQ